MFLYELQNVIHLKSEYKLCSTTTSFHKIFAVHKGNSRSDLKLSMRRSVCRHVKDEKMWIVEYVFVEKFGMCDKEFVNTIKICFVEIYVQ